ncbi:MAG: hypothetical protein E6J83_07825 [Deltaproteobacteria bacterium]|nr:MAG: hypothetical protein E6J83_07825 [Deltaproteobacteria bacterium]
MRRALVLRGAALVALTVVLGARAIDSDVYEGGEAREALVAREMLDTGDWILPLWNGSVVPSKPPLFHWLVASGSRLAGGQVTARTLRAPSVVLAAAVVLLVFLAGLAWGGTDVGTFAALVLATAPQFLTEAGDGRVDMTLTAALTGAQVALVQALGVRRGARLVLAVCLALAMLAKGPVGPGVVGLTALAFAACERRLRPVLGLVRPLPVLLFIVLAGGWYGLAYAHRGMDFVAKQILSENGEALLGSSRFPYRSPLYYVGPLVLGGLPWVLVAPWAAARAWRGELPRRYVLVWVATVGLFFSLAPLKRAAYLLPLRPALALLVGWWLAEVMREEEPATKLVGAARTLALAVAAGALLAAVSALAVGHGLVSTAGLRDVALAPQAHRSPEPAHGRRGDPLHLLRRPPRAAHHRPAGGSRRGVLRPGPATLARVGPAPRLGGGAAEWARLLAPPTRPRPRAAAGRGATLDSRRVWRRGVPLRRPPQVPRARAASGDATAGEARVDRGPGAEAAPPAAARRRNRGVALLPSLTSSRGTRWRAPRRRPPRPRARRTT